MADKTGRQHLRARINDLFATLSREVDALHARQIAERDALLEKHAGLVNGALDRSIAAIERKDPKAAELLRAEYLPIREAMGKRSADLLRPH
jgi:hypothetical protein